MTAIGKARPWAQGEGAVRGLLLAGGVMVAALLVLHYDSSALLRAFALVGGMGLGAAAAVNFAAVLLTAAAWRCLVAGRLGVASFAWFRYSRNAAADLLVFIPGAGELVAVREMFLRGIEYPFAAVSLIADLTVQLVAQLAFTIVGLALLIAVSPSGWLISIALIGLALLIGILTLMIAAQRWGVGPTLNGLIQRILPDAPHGNPNRIAEFTARLRDIYADRRQIASSTFFHTTAWFIGATEAGVILGLVGAWPSLKVTLVLESLILGLRTAIFFVPGAWGAQEAAYILVGSALGLAPEAVLALIIVKRARELLVGVPVLFVGQTLSALRPRA
jgi:putative membrane protein